MTDSPTTSPQRAAAAFLVIGLLGCAFCVVAAILHVPQFFRAYLYAYLFWLGISLGSLALIMVHNLTGGTWGIPIRRAADAASLTLPLMIVLFIPILLGMHNLYAWSLPNPPEELLRHRLPYLHLPFFLSRAAAYFILWTVLAFLLAGFSRQWVEQKNIRAAAIVRRLSAAGLVLYLLTVTHAAVDWVMSRDAAFYSTTFGFIFATGQAASAMAFLILIYLLLPKTSPPQPEAKDHTTVNIDLGNLLLTCIILWAYIAFFQLLVIWMGNTHEDNGWYLQRGIGQNNPWTWIGLVLVIFHFFVPFFLLLSRSIKRNPKSLGITSAIVFVIHLLEQYWIVAPSGPHTGPVFDPSWIDVAAPIAIGGLWLFVFFSIYSRRRFTLPFAISAPREGAAHA